MHLTVKRVPFFVAKLAKASDTIVETSYDQRVQEALAICDMEYLLNRVDNLDAIPNWSW